MSLGASNEPSLISAVASAAASFVSDMSAGPDCELPHHLAALGDLLLKKDALGWRALIEGFR